MELTPGGLLLFAAAALSTAVAVALGRRRRIPEVGALTLVTTVIAFWAFVAGLEALVIAPSGKIWLSKFEHVGANFVGPLLVLFALRLTGHPRMDLHTFTRAALWGMPVINVGVVFTNELHRLVWSGYSPGPAGSNTLVYHHGPWFFVIVGVAYVYAAITLWLLVSGATGALPPVRRQIRVIIVGLAFPWIANIVYVAAPAQLAGWNLTPIAFVGTAAVLAWSVLPWRPFNLVPTARGTLLDTLPEGVLVFDGGGRLADINPSARPLLGLGPEDLGRPAEQVLGAWPELRDLCARPEPGSIELIVDEKASCVLDVSTTAIRARSGMDGTLVLIKDVTPRVRMQRELRRSEQRYRDLVENALVGVYISTLDGRIEYANEVAWRMFGYASAEELAAVRVEDLYTDPQMRRALLRKLEEAGQVKGHEVEILTKQGERRILSISATLSGDRVAGMMMDITEQREAEARLQYLSTHDALTGAYNRGYFDEELARLGRGRRFPVSVIIVDVNGLKGVNDGEGHAAGDQVLRCAYEVLRGAVRGEDVVARIGGDEFGVLLPETDERAAIQAVARMYDRLDKHNRLPGHRTVSMAIGAATAAPHEPLADAVRSADARMYEQKKAVNGAEHRLPRRGSSPD